MHLKCADRVFHRSLHVWWNWWQTDKVFPQGEGADAPVRNIVSAIQDFPDGGPCSAITAPTTNHYTNSSRWNIQSDPSANHRLGGMSMVLGERATHNSEDVSSILPPCWSVDGIWSNISCMVSLRELTSNSLNILLILLPP